jgi:flagellum-specific peptidoglycan hydrolase FlgJ
LLQQRNLFIDLRQQSIHKQLSSGSFYMSLSPQQTAFLRSAYRGALDARHVFPDIAACEAALESAWGTSELAVKANNLFGQKQQTHPVYGTIAIPTREFINHQWVTQDAEWVVFPSVVECFASRMATLLRLSQDYPHYALALEAKSGAEYIREVSLSWSTDPQRAAKVLAIYDAHKNLFILGGAS